MRALKKCDQLNWMRPEIESWIHPSHEQKDKDRRTRREEEGESESSRQRATQVSSIISDTPTVSDGTGRERKLTSPVQIDETTTGKGTPTI